MAGMFLLLLLVCSRTVVSAAEDQKKGSVTLQLPKEAEGVEISLYTIAVQEKGGFVFTEPFASAGIVIENLNDAALAQKAAQDLAGYAVKAQAAAAAVPAADGTIRFTELPPALYLVAQTKGEKILTVQPALIPIPYSSDKGAGLIYDAVVSPKYSLPGGAVLVTKVDENGQPLGLAQFVLQQKVYQTEEELPAEGDAAGTDEKGAYFWKEFKTNLSSDENGQIVITDMPQGDYRLVETQAPEGFIRLTEPVEFSITGAGTVKLEGGIYQKDDGKVEQVTAVNESTETLINKVDEKGQQLAGARLVVKSAEKKALRDKDGQVLYMLTTTDVASQLRGLPPGNYYLSELEAPEGYEIAEDVPFTVSDSPDAVNTVTMIDEETPDRPVKARLSVTKQLADAFGQEIFAENAVYYVALFADEDRTQRVSAVVPITIRNGIRGTAVFDNLEPDRVYYMGETDESGELLESTADDKRVFMPSYDTYEIKLTEEHPEGVLAFENTYYDLPDGHYYGGELTVTKNTLKGTEEYNTTDTFYAAIFTDPAHTERLEGVDVLVLSMDGGCSTSLIVEVPIGEDPNGSVTYYVTETDQYGTPIDNSQNLTYTVSVDKTEVTLSPSDSHKEVIITNTFSEETEETETETETPETGSSTPPSVRTGDDTPVFLWIICIIVSAAAVLFAVKRRSR